MSAFGSPFVCSQCGEGRASRYVCRNGGESIHNPDLPSPGSDEARTVGCSCPVLDNAHGRGYLGGGSGETVFVVVIGCPVHHPGEQVAS